MIHLLINHMENGTQEFSTVYFQRKKPFAKGQRWKLFLRVADRCLAKCGVKTEIWAINETRP